MPALRDGDPGRTGRPGADGPADLLVPAVPAAGLLSPLQSFVGGAPVAIRGRIERRPGRRIDPAALAVRS